MHPQRFGIPSHQELSDSFDSEPTYHPISLRPNSLSVNIASFTNGSYSGVSVNGNYPTNMHMITDMHSNSSGGYVTFEQVHQPPRQTLCTCKRYILIACFITIFVLLIGGLTTTTTLLLQCKEMRGGKEGHQMYITSTSPPKELTTTHANMSESTSETTGLTTTSNAITSTTKSVSTTTKLTSSSTVSTHPSETTLDTTASNPLPPAPSTTRRLPTTTPRVTTCYPLSTSKTSSTTTATTTTLPMILTKSKTTTTQTNESCTRKCHTCTSTSVPSLCPGNGTMTSNHHWHVTDCPCDTTCFTEIRPSNGVHRGCTKDFPHWDILARVNMTCQIVRKSRVCFCLGDRCNTDDMTVFPEYEK